MSEEREEPGVSRREFVNRAARVGTVAFLSLGALAARGGTAHGQSPPSPPPPPHHPVPVHVPPPHHVPPPDHEVCEPEPV